MTGLPSCHALLAEEQLSIPQDFMLLAVSLWKDLCYLVFDGVEFASFKSITDVFWQNLLSVPRALHTLLVLPI